jgi:sec-independent protein translocase protein TatA
LGGSGTLLSDKCCFVVPHSIIQFIYEEPYLHFGHYQNLSILKAKYSGGNFEYLFINGDCKLIFMAFLNGMEWIIIILVIVVIFFGAKKIPELARSMGRATSEFQKARIEAKKSLANESSDQEKAQQSVDREKLESIAETLGVDYSNKNDQDLKNAIDEELKKQGTPK